MATRAFGNLAVKLSIEQGQDSKTYAILTFSNGGTLPYPLLKWLAFPGGRIDDDRFIVTVNGDRAKYIGIMKKRRPATAADFGSVAPGRSVVSRVVLSDAYDLSAHGEVSCTYDTVNPPIDDGPRGDHLRSNTVTFRN